MPTYTLQSPDGRKLDIEATDEATAIKGAQQWAASNPVQPKESVYQKAGRLTGENYRAADEAYRRDSAALMQKGAGANPMDMAKPVLDAAAAGTSWLKGGADALFGDKPVHIPAKVFGLDVPAAVQNINSKGLTAGDLVTFGLGAAPEMIAAKGLSAFAKGANLTARTAENTLAGSRGATAAPATTQANSLGAHVDQFDRAGVRPSIATTSDGAAKVANTIAENALAGGAARANLAGQVQDVQQQAGKIARGYGAPAERASAGEAVQQGVKDFNQRFSDRAETLYTKAFDNIDAAMAGKTDKPQMAVVHDADHGSVTVPMGGSKITTPATSAVIGSMGQAQSKAIGGIIRDATVSKIGTALEDANKAQDLSFQDLRNLRTKVRLAQDNEQLRQDIGAANLQRIEGALTQDINTNAEALAGPKAARQLKQADQFYRLGSQRIQGALQAFVGKNDAATAESAYDRIVTAAGSKGGADSARLLALRKSLQPGEWGDVVASVVDRLGAPTAGAANANEADAFSLGKFVTNYANLSERGKATLFGGPDKEGLRSQLDALAQVAGKVKAVERGANASKSGVSLQNFDTLKTVTAATGTAAALGHFTPLLAEAGVLGGMNITGRILTDPVAVRWLVRLTSAEKSSPAALSSTVGRLGSAARTNTALAPLFEESRKLLPAPAGSAAASDTSQGQ